MLTADTGSQIRSQLDTLLKDRASQDFAIAFSGGGDSTALLHALQGHAHCKAVFIVDHALRETSGKEARAALKFAKDLGCDAHILTWAHDDPSTGLQEKARKARYRLIGEACRARHISNIVTAHTRDDQAETLLMRYYRGTDWRGAAGMAGWTFAHLWPELAGIDVLRPALSATRAALRAYNKTHTLKWIEDPSNSNADFARIRARHYLAKREALAGELIKAAHELSEGLRAEKVIWRDLYKPYISIDENGILHVSKRLPPRLLSLCLQAASGTGVSIKAEKLQTLSRNMTKAQFSGATLGGARIVPRREGWIIVRDRGAILGRPGQTRMKPIIALPEQALWDGRFWISCGTENVNVLPLAQVTEWLSPEQKQVIRSVPTAGRDTLPALVKDNVVLAVGAVISHPEITIKTAISQHLYGRLGWHP